MKAFMFNALMGNVELLYQWWITLISCESSHFFIINNEVYYGFLINRKFMQFFFLLLAEIFSFMREH